MSWWQWIILGGLWVHSMRWSYRVGQKQALLKAATMLEEGSAGVVGIALAQRIRQEYEERLHKQR